MENMLLNDATAKSWCDRLAKPFLYGSGGAVAAIVTRDETFTHSYGHISASAPQPPKEYTLFEIGSISKVFTSIMLADMVREGLLDYDAPIGAVCAEFAGAPEWITPRTLATHTSGLPRIHVPLYRALFMDTTNPYAAFSAEDLIRWMKSYRPKHPPKAGKIRYSNLGVGLLGHVLARLAGADYETALQERICQPLGLQDTAINLSAEQKRRLATPHYGRGKETPPWDFDALAGAGALRSTARDLARFARAAIATADGAGPLPGAIRETLQVQVPGVNPKFPQQCLGWIKYNANSLRPDVWTHEGGTRGSRSGLYIAPDAGMAAVILANHGGSIRSLLTELTGNPLRIIEEIHGGATDSGEAGK